ncbi:hypothetical protein H7F37_15115 [Winogradskyella sp. PAMC22761]|nr:hypothetical protein H7F37_15115 [Winogradskyella sp. PAMC22761]
MKLNYIYSDRSVQDWPSWQIVYEWEDEINDKLSLPIIKTPNAAGNIITRVLIKAFKLLFGKDNIPRFLIKISFFFTRGFINKKYLYFLMSPKFNIGFFNSYFVVPVIIDFWIVDKVEEFKKTYQDCPALLITSLEVLDLLNKHNFPNNLVHFPLSLPDKYALHENDEIDKKYDVVLAGRPNEVLFEYLKTYEKMNPDFEYVYRDIVEGVFHCYSNKNGYLGIFNTREAYFNLLKLAKISFYSTPGIDNGKQTNGLNPVTPRLFEILAAGCHIIMRYPDNRETEFFQLKNLGISVDSFDSFEQQMKTALNTPAPIKRNAKYLANHYTSKRISILKNL